MKVLLCLCGGRGGGGDEGAGMGAQPAQAHGAVGLETTKAKSQSPGTRNSRIHFWFCSRQPRKGDATFKSVRRGSGLELEPSHFSHPFFTHFDACVGPNRV